ncbi:MAG: carboxymuconolactone decarboxylase, partial [Bacteroidota bacterium]
MPRLLCSLLLVLYLAPAAAQKIPDSLNVIFGPGQRIESPNFTGPVWVASLGVLAELSTATEAALDAGLSVGELREALVHLYAYAGFPRSIQGLKTLMAVLEQRKEQGIQDEPGADAGAKQVVGAKYAAGLATLERLTGRAWSEPSGYGEFAPRIDVFLKEHL